MLKLLLFVCVSITFPGCYGCGNSTSGSEVTAQVKKVVKQTPLICPDYVELDVSLGVMRNGVGSMSHEDLVLRVMDEREVPALQKAAKDGAIITLDYDVARVALCFPDHKMKAFKVDIDPAEAGSSAPR